MLFFTALVIFTLSLVLLNFIFSLRKYKILRSASLSALAKSIYYHDCTTFQTNNVLLSYSPILLIRSTVAVFYRSRYFHPVSSIIKLFAYLISILLRFSLILNPWDAYKTLRTRAYVSSWILQFLVKIELKLKLRNLA